MHFKQHIAAVASACMLTAAPAFSQNLRVPMDDARLRAALETIQRDNAWTLDQQVSICEIPAPPFKEAVRAAEFKRWLGE